MSGGTDTLSPVGHFRVRQFVCRASFVFAAYRSISITGSSGGRLLQYSSPHRHARNNAI